MKIMLNTEINDLRDYIPISQEIQKKIIFKKFSDISLFLEGIIINEKNEFLLVEVLRQTFPHKKHISSWKGKYLNSMRELKIERIESFTV